MMSTFQYTSGSQAQHIRCRARTRKVRKAGPKLRCHNNNKIEGLTESPFALIPPGDHGGEVQSIGDQSLVVVRVWDWVGCEIASRSRPRHAPLPPAPMIPLELSEIAWMVPLATHPLCRGAATPDTKQPQEGPPIQRTTSVPSLVTVNCWSVMCAHVHALRLIACTVWVLAQRYLTCILSPSKNTPIFMAA